MTEYIILGTSNFINVLAKAVSHVYVTNVTGVT